MCDYADIPLHDDMRGRSLRTLIEGRDEEGHPFLVCELHAKDARALITRRHKYIVCGNGKRPEMLFDLKEDPGEKRNLAYADEAQKLKSELRGRLQKWLAETDDAFTAEAFES